MHCTSCSKKHFIGSCNLFKSIEVRTRSDFVKEHRLCLRCLERKHFKFANVKETAIYAISGTIDCFTIVNESLLLERVLLIEKLILLRRTKKIVLPITRVNVPLTNSLLQMKNLCLRRCTVKVVLHLHHFRLQISLAPTHLCLVM